jgi:TRAP-type transport system small permease protein
MRASTGRSLLDAVHAISSWLATGGAILGCVALLIMMVLITIDVLGRYIFNSPILGIDHISAYLLVVLVFTGLSYAFKTDAHIRVDVFTSRLSKTVDRRLEIGVYVIGIIGAAVIFWHSLRMVLTSLRLGTRLFPGAFEIPACIPQLFVPLGFGLLVLQMIISFIAKVQQK